MKIDELTDFILKEEDRINKLYDVIKDVDPNSDEVPEISEEDKAYMMDIFKTITENLENLEIDEN